MQKKVIIKMVGDTFFVLPVSRSKYQRRSVAQFYAPDTTLERVQQWVKTNGFHEV